MTDEKKDEKNIVVIDNKPKMWEPGGPSPNPKGRPRKDERLKKAQDYLDIAFGDEGREIFNILIEMLTYDQKTSKDKWLKIRPDQKIKIAELLLAYQLGKPIQNVKAEVEQKTVNINIQTPLPNEEDEDTIIDIDEVN